MNAATSLRRAARQEHARITAEQTRIRDRLEQLQNEIGELERVDGELGDQLRLLDQVLATELGARPASDSVVLRGAGLREQALTVLATRVGIRQPIAYRDWYRLLRDAGFVVLAKRPVAAFLTTVTRSPLIERGAKPGSYYIEPSAMEGLRQELGERRAELRDLESHLEARPAGPSPLERHRLNLMATIRRLERQVAEGERILKAHRDAAFVPTSRAA